MVTKPRRRCTTSNYSEWRGGAPTISQQGTTCFINGEKGEEIATNQGSRFSIVTNQSTYLNEDPNWVTTEGNHGSGSSGIRGKVGEMPAPARAAAANESSK